MYPREEPEAGKSEKDALLYRMDCDCGGGECFYMLVQPIFPNRVLAEGFQTLDNFPEAPSWECQYKSMEEVMANFLPHHRPSRIKIPEC